MENTNKYLEKASSMLLAGGFHVGQNLIAKHLLSSRRYAKSVANSFAEGVHGVVNKSKKAPIANFISGATAPEAAIAKHEAHKLGQALSPYISKMNKRQQVGLRMITEGRFDKVKKYGYHKDPLINRAAMIAQEKTGVPIHHTLQQVEHNHETLNNTFARKDLPLLSNISKHISRGKKPVGEGYGKGHSGSRSTLFGAISAGVADPIAGAMNTIKTVATTDKFKSTRIGAKITEKLQNMFIKRPAKKGWNESGSFNKAKNKAYEIIVNPVAANIERTSHALHNLDRKSVV